MPIIYRVIAEMSHQQPPRVLGVGRIEPAYLGVAYRSEQRQHCRGSNMSRIDKSRLCLFDKSLQVRFPRRNKHGESSMKARRAVRLHRDAIIWFRRRGADK
ncbi:hypothetical protein [Variovorax sp. CCNWLW186]|uniref:hypothetical protein n=1 Tax=Variovorax sp. CCNWLW186 TaxID=3127473 RepID=UPI003078219F